MNDEFMFQLFIIAFITTIPPAYIYTICRYIALDRISEGDIAFSATAIVCFMTHGLAIWL